ncbi:MAG: hypothetical protein ACRELV_12715, partial [Longimicrobiales bacterium]
MPDPAENGMTGDVATADAVPLRELLARAVLRGLSAAEAEAAFGEVMAGRAGPRTRAARAAGRRLTSRRRRSSRFRLDQASP